MSRTLYVAWREFTSVVMTKGFVFGILLTPVIIAVAGVGIYLASRVGSPKIEGRLAIIDATGVVGERVRERLTEKAQQAEQDRTAEQINNAMDRQFGGLPKGATATAKAQLSSHIRQASQVALIDVEVFPAGTDPKPLKDEAQKAEIRHDRGDGERKPLLGVVIVPESVVKPDVDGKYGTFDLFVPPKLDFEIQQKLDRQVGQAIVDARLGTDERVRESKLTPEALRAMLAAPEAKAVTLTSGGERDSVGGLQMLIPVAFMVLLMISVMTAGQYLMTALIEEKSSRVMEVLLSAVSPMQLMIGKILGQMTVALLILVVYGGLGMSGLVVFTLLDLIEPLKLVWLLCYFFIAFFTVASMMAAIGAAVNEMREAQTLLAPVMTVVMLPWFLWLAIQRAPNSTFATVLSFVPFVNPFVMVLRLGGSEPIPFWEIPASMAVGVATMIFSAWAAAKIFRIGILMYGKPPNLATLIRWVRMA